MEQQRIAHSLGQLDQHSHSLTNKQLFNSSENRRPEVVFIGVNYVIFVNGYDASANIFFCLLLFGVLLVLVIQHNFVRLLRNDFARAIPTSVCTQVVLGP